MNGSRETRGNALLVFPEFPEVSFWNYGYMHGLLLPRNRHGYPKALIPPVGLLSILGAVRERYGAEHVRILDMNCRPLTSADLEWADDVYLSGMLTQFESFDEVARRARNMGKTTIGGGPYVSPETGNLDHIVLNECEGVLESFLDDLFAGNAGRIYRGDLPGSADFFKPDFSVIDLKDYGCMAVQFSRGCPHDCEFCDITSRYGRKMRTKSVADFIEELDRLYDLGWRRQVFIVDDNFIGKPRAALELLWELAAWQKKRRYPFEFVTQATVLLAEKEHEELLKAFAPAGFSMVFLGIETPNEESLKEVNKLHNLKPGLSLLEKVKRIQRLGKMMVLGGFVIGFDSDTRSIFDDQVRFIRDAMMPAPMVSLLVPLPETKLEVRLRKEGRLLARSTGSVAATTDVTFLPKNFSREELQEGYKEVLRQIYLDMDFFYERCLESLEYFDFPRFIFLFDEFIGMFRLFYYEGIAGSYRQSFWKYVLRVLLFNPRKMTFGLRWAAFGLHYRHLTRHLTD